MRDESLPIESTCASFLDVTITRLQQTRMDEERCQRRFVSLAGPGCGGEGGNPAIPSPPLQSYALANTATLNEHVNMIKCLKIAKYLSGNSADKCQNAFSFTGGGFALLAP